MTTHVSKPTRPPEHADQLERVRGGLKRADRNELTRCLSGLHPSDIADTVEALGEEERLELFRLLPPEKAAAALAEMEPDHHPERIVAGLSEEDAAAALARMADDDATDVLNPLRASHRRRLLAALPRERADTLRRLLHYEEDCAGGIMTTDLVVLSEELTADDAIAEVRRQGRKLEEEFYLLFVVDARRRLTGTVSLRDLVLAAGKMRLSDLAEVPPATVGLDMHQEEVAHILHRYDLPTIAVVDEEGTLLGHVTFDDVMDVLEEEQTEDILRLSGAGPEEEVRGGWTHAVRSRLPWLFVNLGTGALAASVVYLYQETVDRLVILASVMPVVAALGGNAGTQALAVTIRRITLEQDAVPGRWRVAAKELLVGLVNGAAVGLAVTLVWLVWRGDLTFGLVILIAMWGNLIVASFAGAFVPIVLERAGVDPAVASSVFVTTFTDLAGFFLLLGLATIVLL